MAERTWPSHTTYVKESTVADWSKMRRYLGVLFGILFVTSCGEAGPPEAQAFSALPLEGAVFADLASECAIADPAFGRVKLFGDLDMIGFAITREAAPDSIRRESSGDDPLPDRSVCLQTGPSKAVQGCGVVDWLDGPITMHAAALEVTPILFDSDDVFAGAPTLLFATCPGSAGDGNPTLFDVAASSEHIPSPYAVGNGRIADVLDQVTDEAIELDVTEPLNAIECTDLSDLLFQADAMHAAARKMLGSETLYPETISINFEAAEEVLLLTKSMRTSHIDSSLDGSSIDPSVGALLLTNVAWEGLALSLADVDNVPTDLQDAWTQWSLGASIDRPFAADTEAHVTHLRKVLDLRCS